MLGLFLILAIVGAVYDYKYIANGGNRPTRSEKIYLIIAIALVLVSLIGLGVMGANPEGLGSTTVYLAVVLFCLWELRRFFVRRANPIPRDA